VRSLSVLAGIAVVALAVSLHITRPLAAEDSLKGLLDRLGSARPAPEGRISAMGWVERQADGYALVVSLEPSGAARLLADPGITLEPQPAPRVSWSTDRLYLDYPAKAYFDSAPVLRLPFKGDAASVTAKVEYAYCLVDYQCLFGETTVEAELPRGG